MDPWKIMGQSPSDPLIVIFESDLRASSHPPPPKKNVAILRLNRQNKWNLLI